LYNCNIIISELFNNYEQTSWRIWAQKSGIEPTWTSRPNEETKISVNIWRLSLVQRKFTPRKIYIIFDWSKQQSERINMVSYADASSVSSNRLPTTEVYCNWLLPSIYYMLWLRGCIDHFNVELNSMNCRHVLWLGMYGCERYIDINDTIPW
jgi:hypothetical protein